MPYSPATEDSAGPSVTVYGPWKESATAQPETEIRDFTCRVYTVAMRHCNCIDGIAVLFGIIWQGSSWSTGGPSPASTGTGDHTNEIKQRLTRAS